MFKIPKSFRDDYENYLIIPIMREFLLQNEICSKGAITRAELIDEIEKYANESEEKQIQVLEWLNEVLKEGVKHIYIRKVDIMNPKWEELVNMNEISDELLCNAECQYICGNNGYDDKLQLIRFEKKESERGKILSFYFAELVHIHDKRGDTDVIYPIFIDVYEKYGLITGRAKSKASMYQYTGEDFSEKSKSTNAYKEITKAFEFIANKFGIGFEKLEDSNIYFKEKFYALVNKYTETPEKIKNKIIENKTNIEEVVFDIVHDICIIDPLKYEQDVRVDILNLIEKYFSISYPDNSIFIEGRNAYPIKIIATDEEESHLEQAAGVEEPLQSKAMFFDNKKMMQKNKKCDGVIFSFERKERKDRFKVEIRMEKMNCFLRCNEYIREEEIQNVLFSIIEAE